MATATVAKHIQRKNGAPIQLGRELGQGGEGSVYEVVGENALVAKIYKGVVEPGRAAKLRAMSELSTEALSRIAAWPSETLHGSNGKIVGFLMPKIGSHRPIHMLYSPKTRAQEFPQATWAFLAHVALNASKAFAVVHQHGHAVGDVNENNILVDDEGTVRLIDCDSFSVTHQGTTYPCEVGVPIFTPPELQGQSLRGVVRTTDHDTFGLAVLNFLLLFMGRHPFAGRFLGGSEKPLEEMIAEMRFAFGERARELRVSQPPNTPVLADVGSELAPLFESAFSKPQRPRAQDWVEALSVFKTHLKPCLANRSHIKHDSRECQWCHIEHKGIYYFKTVFIFSSGAVPGGLELTQAGVDQIWTQIEQVKWPGAPPPKPRKLGVPMPPSTAVQRLLNEADRDVAPAYLKQRSLLSLVLFFVILLYSWVVNPVALLALLIPLGLYGIKRGPTYDKLRSELKRCEAERANVGQAWQLFESKWVPMVEILRRDAFKAKRAELEHIYRSLKNLNVERSLRVQMWKKHKRRFQLEQHLARIRLRDASIEGIGPSHKATLLSNGIETALDVTPATVGKCPGFSRTNVHKLLAWRADLEKRFKANDALDAQGEARVEEQLRDFFKSGLEKLHHGLTDLHNIQQRTLSIYQGLQGVIGNEGSRAARQQGQLDADINALKSRLR